MLYQRFGFRPVGVRPRYYSDNGEDALIMTTDPLDSAADAQPHRGDGRAVRTPATDGHDLGESTGIAG